MKIQLKICLTCIVLDNLISLYLTLVTSYYFSFSPLALPTFLNSIPFQAKEFLPEREKNTNKILIEYFLNLKPTTFIPFTFVVSYF